jgi:hypothetical protein
MFMDYLFQNGSNRFLDLRALMLRHRDAITHLQIKRLKFQRQVFSNPMDELANLNIITLSGLAGALDKLSGSNEVRFGLVELRPPGISLAKTPIRHAGIA